MRVSDQLHVAVQLLRAMRSQWWPAPRIRAHQQRLLVRMMRYASAHVPFYQRLQLSSEQLVSAADLQRFPIINKSLIQREPEAFLAAGSNDAELYKSRTSGSSGQPTTTCFDREAWLLSKYALKMRRIVATAGLPVRRRVLIISELSPEQLRDSAPPAPLGFGVFFQQLRLSVHTPPEQHLSMLAHFRPHIIYAFPSYLLDLVTVAASRGVALPPIPTLCTSSEVLTAAARNRIEAAFHGRLFDVYGSTEFKEVAWQCSEGRYHLNFESVFMETSDSGGSGAVVLSTLCNLAMPLLRFDIGDRAQFGTGRCPCGRQSPHMLAFSGREGDMITLPSGRRLSPYLLTTAIESEDSILQYRIIQTAAAAFRVDVIVRVPGQSAAWSGRVCAELARIGGEAVRFEIREVQELERERSGKRSVFRRAMAGTG